MTKRRRKSSREPIPAKAVQLVRRLVKRLGEDEVWIRCRWSYKSGWSVEVVVSFSGYYDRVSKLLREVRGFKWVVSWHKEGLELHVWHDDWYEKFKKNEARES
jgi:hypothetical protein